MSTDQPDEKPRVSDAEMLARFQNSTKRPPCSVEARILKWGRSAAFMEAECFDADGKLVAKATATAIPMPFKRLS